MAIELGAAYISILPSTDKLAPAIKKDLAEAEGDAKSAGGRAGSGFGSGFKSTVGGILKGGVLAAVGGAGLLGGLGVKTAAEMETAQIAFTTMLGSAEKAKTFIKDLTDFAAKTPFEFPGLQTAASSLISAGIATRDVLPIMETLGNVTSGMGTGSEGIQRATVALQQMNAAGKVTGEDLNQLRDAGIPVFDLLSASMGKSKAEIAELAQTGKLGAEGLNAIMSGLKTGKGLERFDGLMEKQSASLSGQFSTLKDTFSMGLANAMTPILPILKEGLGAVSKNLAPAMERLGSGAKVAALGIKNFVSEWKSGEGTGGKFRDVLTAVKNGVAGVVAFMVKWQDVLIPVGAGILAIIAAIKIWRTVTAAFVAVQTVLNIVLMANPIGLIILAIVALVAAFVVAYKRSETFRNVVNGALEKVRAGGVRVKEFFTRDIPAAFDKVKEAAGKALGWVRQNWPKILAFLTGPIGLAVYAIAKNWDKIKSGATAAKDWIARKFGDLVGFVRGLPGRISSAASGMFKGITDAFRAAINSVIGMWNGLNFSLPSISIKGKEIFGGGSFGTPDIPYLAKGGLLTKPTLNVAGEAGPEAVTPLDRLEGWINRAAQIGASNAEGRGYTNPAPGGSGSARRTEFVITNWRTGEGYFREIAEDTYHGEDEFAGTTRRMR